MPSTGKTVVFEPALPTNLVTDEMREQYKDEGYSSCMEPRGGRTA